MSYCNFRIGTKIEHGERVYKLIECCYNDGDNIPHTHREVVTKRNDIVTLASEIEGFPQALDRPFIDLDDWPNEIKST